MTEQRNDPVQSTQWTSDNLYHGVNEEDLAKYANFTAKDVGAHPSHYISVREGYRAKQGDNSSTQQGEPYPAYQDPYGDPDHI